MTVTRFAPSPTGRLHLGNARLALINWLAARVSGGRFLLRLDDTDPARSDPAYAAAIERDLHWLGLQWDGFFRQSDRLEAYREAAGRLKAAGHLYPCYETETELAAKREAARQAGRPPIYDRAALTLGAEERAKREAAGQLPYWRFRLADATIAWQDLVLGPRQISLASQSDPVLLRADGTPLYLFTSVVDDIAEAVDPVIRGEDHVTNTALQIDLFGALGAQPPRFAHLPLLCDSAGGKLSKRLDSLSLESLRAQGVEPEALAGLLARLGTSAALEPVPPAALIAGFNLKAYAASPPSFDPHQLGLLNRRWLSGLDYAAACPCIPSGASEEFWLAIRNNIARMEEAASWWHIVAGEIPPSPLPEAASLFAAAAASLPPEPWDRELLASWIGELGQATKRRGRALYHPLRLALTGREEGPELLALLKLMGRKRALLRLAPAVSRVRSPD